MTNFYVFNGDADGLCALQQLRLTAPSDATLVTGVKRDVSLLQRVDAAASDAVTVLDISLSSNHESVIRLLDAGVLIRYFDHHFPGEIPQHPNFEPHIDEALDVCTSILVDRYCEGRYHYWAITAAFGDSLDAVAFSMAKAAGIDLSTTTSLMQLGRCLNYNAYGDTVSDLHFDPAQLADLILPYQNPVDFIRSSSGYTKLVTGYEEDLVLIRQLKPLAQTLSATIFVLPKEAWARRAIGVFANEWIGAHPNSALAILSPKPCGHFLASVRVPANGLVSADTFCRGFETGGGRKLAAGINHLPAADVDIFMQRFQACFNQA